MTPEEKLTRILRDWSELFMHRSFCDFKQFMDASGLSTSQVSTLMRLYHGGTCGVSNIGEHLGVTAAAASQLVERLVQQGLLERTEDRADRRARHVNLTPAGLALIEAGVEARRRWLEALTQELTPLEQEKVTEAFKLLTEAGRRLDRSSL